MKKQKATGVIFKHPQTPTPIKCISKTTEFLKKDARFFKNEKNS